MARHTKTVNTSLSMDIYQSVEELAKQKGISISEFFRQALMNYVIQEQKWQRIYKLGEK